MPKKYSKDNVKEKKTIIEECKKYFNARKSFLELAQKPGYEILDGNDNIVGSRIGEFIAAEFILDIPGRKWVKKMASNNRGYDLVDDEGNKISVKIITAENKKGNMVRIQHPWDELIFIELDEDYKTKRIGYLTKKQFKRAKDDNFIRNNPRMRRGMLNSRGLIGHYGKVYKQEEISQLFIW